MLKVFLVFPTGEGKGIQRRCGTERNRHAQFGTESPEKIPKRVPTLFTVHSFPFPGLGRPLPTSLGDILHRLPQIVVIGVGVLHRRRDMRVYVCSILDTSVGGSSTFVDHRGELPC
ncbi:MULTISPECIES: hypothetical protein [unclassified Chelatococcus]|uniref:hypothetical protein n=1 Tax=unclassified Chelatococcus TaxID=2638111 RepID=UPI0012E2FF24|nr:MULTISPECIES: hypothetical protein [unclassified Chelatococcus]